MSPLASAPRSHPVSTSLRRCLYSTQSLRRIIEVSGVAGVALARYLVSTMVPGRRNPAWRAKIGVDALQRAGGAFVKIGQVLATREDLFGRETLQILGGLCDQGPRVPWSRLKPAVASLLKTGVPIVWFDEEPIAVGSLAQVHRARLSGGCEVVLKIKRPGSDWRIRADLRLIGLAVPIVSRSRLLRDLPCRAGFASVSEAVETQADFLREGESLRRLGDIFRSNPHVAIPKVFKDWSTKDVVVSEYLPGLRRLDEEPLEDNRHAGVLALHTLYEMIFVHGFVHCDFHPGNVLRQGTRVAILDTGYMFVMSDSQIATFRKFFRSVAFCDVGNAADLLIRISETGSEALNPGAFRADLKDLIVRVNGLSAARFSVANFVRELFAVLRKHHLHAAPDFTMPILALLVYEGTISRLAPDLDFQREAIPYLEGA